jgi:hypothetical protein
MAKRKSTDFLPQVFQTKSNTRFLNATLDQLIQEPSLTKIYGYIGQQDQSPVYKTTDYYINEGDNYAQFYQLEPGVVIKKRQVNTNNFRTDNVYTYPDLLNQIVSDGGIANNHSRMFTNEFYNYTGFVDIEKLTNYRQYYWVPAGPYTVDVTSSGAALQENFNFHLVSYVSSGQTELQSASLGKTGYRVDGYNNVNNPTITLQRGGRYTFNVAQTGRKFYIQTEIGTSGVSSIQNNISTRDVLGVENNGTDSGEIVFNVPVKTAQDYLLNLPSIPNIDLVTDIPYNEIQGVDYTEFLKTHSLDGVRSFGNKYVVLTDEYAPNWLDVPYEQRTGIWNLVVGQDNIIRLKYYGNWPKNTKTYVNEGTGYGHKFIYKNSNNLITAFPPLTAAQNTLYYQDANDPLIYGQIILIDPDPYSILNVNDIIGRDYYTSPNGVQFTSGLKVRFTGDVVPDSYTNKEYIVEGVGTGIKLIPWTNLQTPELINNDLGSYFGADGETFGTDNFDGSKNWPADKEYVTINRASRDGNGWSRGNRWFHRDVLQYAATKSGQTFQFDSADQASRPIVEFIPDLKLFNSGTQFAGNITAVDMVTTNAFSQVEGTHSGSLKTNGVFNSDGIELLNQSTVVFMNDADPDVRKTVYQVQNVYERSAAIYTTNTFQTCYAGTNVLHINVTANLVKGQYVIGTGIPSGTTVLSVDVTNNQVIISNNLSQDIPVLTNLQFNNNADQIKLVPLYQVNDGDSVLALEGAKYQGNMFYYVDGTWINGQQKTQRPQFPLFDIIDINSVSLSDKSVYTSSTFAGSQLFGYEIGTGTRDQVLNFPIVYQNIGNIGDIVFENFYVTDTFHYSNNRTDTQLNLNSLGYAAVNNGWNNYGFSNGWVKVNDKSKQYITKTFDATTVKTNEFAIDVIYENSYYENDIFVYVNQVLQPKNNYALLTNNTGSILQFVNDLSAGDRVFVKIYGTSGTFKQTYTMPKNLTNNGSNEEFSTVTLGEMRNHLIEMGNNILDLVGEPAGINNFRDLNYTNVGGKLLQHSASVKPAALMFSNPDVDPVKAITLAMQSYDNFKNQLFNFIDNLEFPDTTDIRQCLDIILDQFSQNGNINAQFNYTDMVAYGKNYISNDYKISNTGYRTFNLVNSYVNKPSNFQSVLVYRNSRPLIKDRDYTIDNLLVTITDSVSLARNDIISIFEYSSTMGCNIPSTPSKLGLYPKYIPTKLVDDTYRVPQTVIIGHDGSRQVAWGDYRDDILLEYETRVYNNIDVSYNNDMDYDIISIEPGAFRKSSYSLTEWTQLLAGSYLSWSGVNNVDIFTNTITSDDLFSLNYATGRDKVFNDTVPGYWRGIYKYFYDTDQPHSHPWEMLGLIEQPSWWTGRYGPAPYTSQNALLWDDLESGFIYNGNANQSYVNIKYARPGLSKIIPVDDHGNLLAPLQCVLSDYDTGSASNNWRIGDQSPQETAWRRSSSYPFAIQIAWCLARPAEYCALKYNTRDIQHNAKLDQILNIKNNNRKFDYSMNGPDEYIPGLNVWIRERLTNLNLDVQANWLDIVQYSSFNLVYKMSGFTDKSYLTVVADQVSPQSKNVSVLIPPENYEVFVAKSAPVSRAVYSAVTISKTAGGYQVYGFDKERPYFLTIPSLVNNNNYSITVGNTSATIYKDSENTLTTFPYGAVLQNRQQVVDFLISYGRYLINQGFVFDSVLPDNTTIQDWVLSAKEFLFWDQQNWGPDTVIGVTPAGTNIKYLNNYGMVDTISNDYNYTKIINSDGKTLSGFEYSIARLDNTLQLALKDSTKGIHLLDIAVVQYEHALIFDNVTLFNDIVYDELVGSRQFRLRLDGAKTTDWNGSFYAPGFLINYRPIEQFQTFTDYSKGEIVLNKSQYYAAKNFVPGASKFVESNWYKISGKLLDKQLIPNMASGAAQFVNFYDADKQDLNNAADVQSKHSIGFQPRQYLTDLGLDMTSQYKFYQGMIAQKGTQAVMNAFLRNKQENINTGLELVEQWAIKLGDFGGTDYNKKLEFNLSGKQTLNNNYLFEFATDDSVPSTDYNTIRPQDMLIRPDNFDPDVLAMQNGTKNIVSLAGPVQPADVSAAVFDINKIYNIQALNAVLGEGSKIWIASDTANKWGVYRLSQTDNLRVTNVHQYSPTELTFETNLPHNLQKYDFIMLKDAKIRSAVKSSGTLDLSGFYRISAVQNTNFTVKIVNNTAVSTGQLSALMYKLQNVRFSNIANWANFTPIAGYNIGEIVYIDNGPNGYQVKRNEDRWLYNETRSPHYTVPADQYGTSIKINHDQSYALVGAPGKGNTGQVFNYALADDNTWQETGVLVPKTANNLSFGTGVDYNNLNFGFISSPDSNYKGSVYVAIANSQSLTLNQCIHYDNINVTSVNFQTTNNAVLFSSALDLSNFAVGMGIGGPGIANGTVITSLTNTGLYHKVGLSANCTIPAASTIGVYPDLPPGSKFGTGMSASADGAYLYASDPINRKVYAYQYQYVDNVTYLSHIAQATGDGSTTIYDYPARAVQQNLGPNDFKVYVADVLQTPYVDYFKVPAYDQMQFVTAPASGATIQIIYSNYYKRLGSSIITADPAINSFGTSISTTTDGRYLMVGDPDSSATVNNVSYTGNGGVYLFERTVENFISNGNTVFTTVNNFANTCPVVKIDGQPLVGYVVDGFRANPNVAVDATLFSANNTVILSTTPGPDTIVSIETNQFNQYNYITSDSGQTNQNFGKCVKISSDGASYFVGAPGYNSTKNKRSGMVYQFIDVAKTFGYVTGNNANWKVNAGDSIRINDFLVTFTGGDVVQTAADINNAYIPGVGATVNSNGSLTIYGSGVQPGNKLRIRQESGSVFYTIGIKPTILVQKFVAPVAQDTQNYGGKISLSPDNRSLVIAATLSNNKITTTFDSKLTVFDHGGLQFRDTVYRSGAAHVYEYQDSQTNSYYDQGYFAYARLLSQNSVSSLDAFGTGVDISDNFLLVGAPNGRILDNQTGVMHSYYNRDSLPVWNVIREAKYKYDSSLVKKAYLYNSFTGKLITDLPVIDLAHGFLPLSSESHIKYTTNYDPAIYNNVPSTVSFNYDIKNSWGSEHVGTLWWDTNNIKYYDTSQHSTLDAFKNWGLAFPQSRVLIYEWVESDYPPSQFSNSMRNTLMPPLYTINDVYSSKVVIDPESGVATTKYYFWVRNSTKQYKNINRPTALEIQSNIRNPRAVPDPFLAVVNSRSVAIFNASNKIDVNTNLVLEYQTENRPQLVHNEWTLFDDGTDLGVAREFLDKLCDSLVGQDAQGRPVPDITLPANQLYGMSIRPRQTLFSNPDLSRKLYVEQLNIYSAQIPMVLSRPDAIQMLSDAEAEPDASTYVLRLADQTELNYIDKNYYNPGDLVLVANDTEANGNWTIYQLMEDENYVRTWELIRVQTYNLKNYWNYADWFSQKYKSSLKYNHYVDYENQIPELTLNVGDIVYVANSNQGGWKWVLINSTGLELLAQQNATIEFSSKLYQLTASGFGYSNSSYENSGYNTDANLEFRSIFSIVQDHILNNDYRSYFKNIIKIMIDQIANQHLNTDWLMKTSLVDIYHRVRGLSQLPVYLPQPETIVTDFFAEAKPYHAKLKQYVAKYDNTDAPDTAEFNLTDYDLPVYYNNNEQKYRSPVLGNPLDSTTLTTSSVYQPWLNNYLLKVTRVDVYQGGSNYDGTTTVKIKGDGAGATATALVLEGQIYSVVVTNPGYGYTKATAEVYGLGSGAVLIPILGHNDVRSLDTYIKFDRYTYLNSIQDWASGVNYAVDTVVVYNGQPYRAIQAHTSTDIFNRFDFIPLVVKVWYQNTPYAANDIVIYGKQSYVAHTLYKTSFTGDGTTLQFNIVDSNISNLESVKDSEFTVIVDQHTSSSYTIDRSVTNTPAIVFATAPAAGANIIVQYRIPQDFTSGIRFDTEYLTAFSGIWLDNACDRIWSYYSPVSGMAGRDLSQLMTGIEFPGVSVTGPSFTDVPGYDVNTFDTISYDLRTVNLVTGIVDIYGEKAIDTQIKSDFLDTGLGLRPEDILVLGGGFVDSNYSHAPEELVPGIVNDTLDIRVRTLPLTGSPEIAVYSTIGNNQSSVSFDPKDTGVRLPISGIDKILVIFATDAAKGGGPQIEGVDYTVNWQEKKIEFINVPANNFGIYVLMLGSTGLNPVYDGDYYADGTETDFIIPDANLYYIDNNGNKQTKVQQAYVKVNGFKVTNWQLVNKVQDSRGELAVRFLTAPAAGDYVQVHLYAVPDNMLGKKEYTEITEQYFTNTTGQLKYPENYTFVLQNPVQYYQPVAAYSLVRVRSGAGTSLDLIPPQQTYYYGDNVRTTFTMSNSYKTDFTLVPDGNILVTADTYDISGNLVRNKLQVRGVDYTINRYTITGVAYIDIVFNTPPALQSLITISDSSNADYNIYTEYSDPANPVSTLILNQNYPLNVTDGVSVITMGNHDTTNMFTKIFSGSSTATSLVDLGFDNLGFENLGFDNELSDTIVNPYYDLPIPVYNINQLYITVKDPGTSGGYTLSPNSEYYMVTPTRLQITTDPSVGIRSNSTIVVRVFGYPERQNPIEFRIFKDINNLTKYYAVKATKTTKLAQDLQIGDSWIYCQDVSNLQNPDPANNQAGIVMINGERITYGFRDTVNNRLGKLIRSTAGTGAPDVHRINTVVTDMSGLSEIPNSRDQYITSSIDTSVTNGYNTTLPVYTGDVIRQGKLFVNPGERLQDSQTTAAKFIREQ